MDALNRILPLDSLGGPYGWLTHLAPWYSLFRYPAKWTVFVAFFLCFAAAANLSKETASVEASQRSSQLKCWLIALAVALVILLACCWYVAVSPVKIDLERWLSKYTNDVWLGPASLSAVQRAGIAAIALPLFTLCLLRLTYRSQWMAVGLTLIELTAVGMFWVHYVPRTSFSDQSVKTAIGPESFVWANTHAARILDDLAAPHLGRDRKVSMEEQTSYQMQFLLGKLSVLKSIRALHANTSLTPREITQIKSWLRQRDNLAEANAPLDEVLRELGITHRLVRRTGQSPAVYWQPISDPKPFCELFANDSAAVNLERLKTRALPCDFAWKSSDELEVHWRAEVLPEGSNMTRFILVRQFNDGGWIARTEQGLEVVADPGSLFLKFPIDDQTTTLNLSRLW